MDKLIQEYMKSMNFEEFSSDTITTNDLEALETKQGVIILTDTTDLWITRSIVVMDVLGVQTVFESTQEFMILDNFGMKLWNGDAKEVIEYVEGFVGGEEPEF